MRYEGHADREDGDEALDRVRASARGLKRYERAALERVARDKRANPYDVTPEQREIINGSLSRFAVYEGPNSRVIVGFGHQIASPIQKLYDAGRIEQEDVNAATRFQRDFILGTRVSITSKYSELMGLGGTPAGQQKNDDCPETERLKHQISYRNACEYIGKEQSPWLTAVVCEVPVGEPGKVPSFEDVGREYAGYTNRPQAKSAGETLVMEWVRRLSKFYGTRR